MINGSIIRVHQHGAKKEQDAEAMGKYRGGLPTKNHAAVDFLNYRAVRLLLTQDKSQKMTKQRHYWMAKGG